MSESENEAATEKVLRERAQVLLDSVAPGGVPQEVADGFLRDLEAIVSGAVAGATDRLWDSVQGGGNQWAQYGLSGAVWQVGYTDTQEAAGDVHFLMSHGHGHHFAVVGEGLKIIMSQMATECLRAHRKDMVVATVPGRQRAQRAPGPDLGDDPDGDLEGADYPPFPAGS